jgi:hypothetical protein
VSGETARRLACDASLVRVVHDGEGRTLDVGRKTRTINPALRRALRLRDKCCRFPGCANHRFTEGHHHKHWADGGETKLSNVLLLCKRHHRLVHEGGYGVERDSAGTFRFTRPDGTVLRPAPPPPPPRAPSQITDEDLHRDRHRLRSTYDGGFVDYGEIGAFIGGPS